MLGPYLAVPQRHAATARNPDLARYLRSEYVGNMTVAELLAGVARVSQKSRTKGAGRIADALRTLAKAFGAIAAGRRSKAPTPEV